MEAVVPPNRGKAVCKKTGIEAVVTALAPMIKCGRD
jgi:hypothetical protein